MLIKKIIILLIMLVCIHMNVKIALAVCPVPVNFSNNCQGTIMNICTPSSICQHSPKFWCLSSGGSNNNGSSYYSWWQHYSGNIWWFNGSWSFIGINGCCGMWDPSSCSKTMQVVVDSNDNEGYIEHTGYANVELAERPDLY